MALDREEQSEERRYGFRIGGLGFLIPPHVGSEALAMPVIAPIPNAPGWLHGVFNLRGQLVPLVNLHRSFGLEHDAAAKAGNMALVFGSGAEAVSVLIDDYPKPLLDLRPVAELPDIPDLLGRHAGQGYMSGGGLWLELDLQALLLDLASA